MKAKKFFEERSDQSEVKARIVTKYFFAWARVIMPTAAKHGGKIAYIDLYAGPGRYRDGAASTPLLVLQTALDDARMAQMLVSYFNDARNENTATLQEEINKLPGIEKFTYKPIVTCGEVDDEAARYFNETKLIPSFSFIDPFGYKGLSLNIIKGVIKDWGCDCVFFFNYNRINAGIGNQFVAQHMDDLFGRERAEALRKRLPGLSPELREAAILEELANEIKRLGGTYVLPFTFKNAAGTRTSHKLIFVSKHFRGYSIMKSIMAGESSTHDEGVPSLTYSPADASMPLLFSLAQPLSKLKESLLATFAGREVKFTQIYETHSVDTPYIDKNYREILKQLENEAVISVRSTKGKRRAGTFADHVLIKFPGGGHIGH
ncbi:MAG: three-Cys-motif partner protein TcmP [Alphaproteobacteria bacterium]|nr:three-Cys-motif partner protein TcmP [Alphaproteobacteria bacterium]MEC9264991.1 three-Cys-motif partner protein TcmP [Pseudomonadota bacterium]